MNRAQPSPAGAGHPMPEDAQLDALLAQALSQALPPEPEPLDAATHARVMARLRAGGAFDVPPEPSPAPQARANARPAPRLAPWWRWFIPAARPAGQAAGFSWAVPAMAALATMVVTFWPGPGEQSSPENGDAGQRGLPSESAPEFTPKSIGHSHGQWMLSHQPAADAAQLAKALTQAGATVQVRVVGHGRTVLATVPVAALPAVNEALTQWGLEPAQGAELTIHMSAAPDR